ncbi:MAG: 4Fe-4S binding protein [Planctomycetales bacterium]
MRWPQANHFFGFLKPRQRTGWRGRAHGWLARLGPTWRSAPFRRVIQAVCLVLFLHAFFYVCWPYADDFSTGTFHDKQHFPAEAFLLIDPLVGLSTALAGKLLNWATLAWMLGILAFCIVIPRAFCGYFCPLGTLIDVFDRLVGRHFQRFHVRPNGPSGSSRWWVHIKYYVLAAVLATSLFGVLTSGFFSAIPVLTRGLLFIGGYPQLAALKGAHNVPPLGWTFYLSLALFFGVFGAGLMGKRFWCRYLCPSGALLSVFNFFRVTERKVESSCINCNKCVEICPFDAILEDFNTRTADCTWCQTCGGVCPTHSIKFVTRWDREELKEPGEPAVQSRPLSRRGFVAAAVLGASAAALTRVAGGAGKSDRPRPLRPPGSVPEEDFLGLCIRCGECFKVCPGPVLQPAGLEHGLDSLWTPVARPEHAGCHQDCNFCTQVCPTGAIQPLGILLKRRTHMGLAKINTEACLPYREDGRREYCDLCVKECASAGYHAIRFEELRIELDPPPPEGLFTQDELDAMSFIQVPVVDAAACVGCGICEYRCHTALVAQEKVLDASAIVVVAENEHRLRRFPTDPAALPPAK